MQGSSRVIKLGMPLYAWIDIIKIYNEIRKNNKDFVLEIEKYEMSKKHGRLYFDLVSVLHGAREKIEPPEFYK